MLSEDRYWKIVDRIKEVYSKKDYPPSWVDHPHTRRLHALKMHILSPTATKFKHSNPVKVYAELHYR